MIDQQKDDAARLTVRLSGTEKQRDDALEALVLQQEIAEELERERKRNRKELAGLQHTNITIIRQRDEAQRVVLHLRSLINGQTHHMEHIVRSLGKSPELSEYLEDGFEDLPEDGEEGVEPSTPNNADDASEVGVIKGVAGLKSDSRASYSRASTLDGNGKPLQGEDVTPEMESRFFNSLTSKRFSQLSMADVADRHLRDKTDAIADIIRNISEQCAAAVEGLQLAQDADNESESAESKEHRDNRLAPSEDGQEHSIRTDGSEMGEPSASDNGAEDSSFLSPDGRNSSIPPTPDLVHNRSSTSMSMVSSSTTPDRASQQYTYKDVRTKIVEDNDAHEKASVNGDSQVENGHITKQPSDDLIRPATARLVGQ